jgi:2-amino-4-hydroxy-6-hydroxymethyldihydropteridine diphosphokinase
MLRAVVGFGANLGDRLAMMRAAVRELARAAHVDRTSHVYATAPVGGGPQPDFLNAAALVRYEGTPEQLLDVLLAIEVSLGRVRREKWGPRTIDLDLLWSDGVFFESARLTVPHPQLPLRAFAVVPLLELVPEAIDPRTGDRYTVPLGEVRALPEMLRDEESSCGDYR